MIPGETPAPPPADMFREALGRLAGQKVRFVIHNGDPIDHEFIVGDERVQAIHEKGTEAHHGSRPGEVSIEALGEATTTYTFTQPGTLLIGCHLPNHYDYGMRGVVVIE